ncbi:prepilin peptidase [Actinomadura rupiterrae]|uniref:prepilin peptidase n=1 Tax=Actinomadura rupiterrae TaxID=559627 RepID=UPI0020A43D62|nr:A24 family peptidase [Actinomadura rupiterrae]MCP2338334.1 leader peptidase (prepilin peptidase)/N-methyltransferase [Actinomadura rupiterrae]
MSAPVWSVRADWTEPLRNRWTLPGCAVLALALGVRVGWGASLPAFVFLGVLCVLLGAVDVALKRLPDPLTLPSVPIAAALLLIADPSRWTGMLAGAGLLFLVFAVQWFIVPNAIGIGDVKLTLVLGLYLGWLGRTGWVTGLFGMFVLGGLFALGLLVSGRAGRKDQVPYGPFMLAGTLLAVLLHA